MSNQKEKCKLHQGGVMGISKKTITAPTPCITHLGIYIYRNRIGDGNCYIM